MKRDIILRRLLLLAGCALLAWPVVAGKPADSSENSLLWMISGKDLKQPSYIFGTLHLLCPDDYIWTRKMETSLLACSEVCFEMDLSNPLTSSQVAAGLIDHSGKSLRDYFEEEDFNKLSRFLQDSIGMSITLFQNLKPAALQLIFASHVVHCAAPVSYETQIMEIAKNHNLQISGLEEAGEQVALFDNMQSGEAIQNLLEMVKDYSKERKEYQELLEAYKRQDIQKLYKMMESTGGTLEDRRPFVEDRNKKWVARMEEKMEQQPVFFAVGAAHLPGNGGLIALLRKEGYTVSPAR